MLSTGDVGAMNFLENDALVAFAGLGAAAAIFFVWQAMSGSEISDKRLKSVLARRADLQEQMKNGTLQQEGLFHKGMLQEIANHLKSLPWFYSTVIKKDLVRAGFRDKSAILMFGLAKVGLPILMLLLFMFLTGVLGLAHGKALIKLLMMFGLPVLGFMMPDLWLKNTIQKREEVLRKTLPDAFDLLVICAEAGLGLDAALERVSRETAQSQPVLAEEIGITAVELGFLPDRRAALLGFSERVQLPAIRALANTLIQSERYGTPLAQALRVLSGELRDERMMKAEEKAAKLPATLTVPMILFILPTLFIVLLGPAILQVLDLFKG
jgi:tight adherence protein C